MKWKKWKLWLLAGVLFLFTGIMVIIDKMYVSGFVYIALGICYLVLSIGNYKLKK